MASKWQERPERGGRRITRFYIWLCLTVGRRWARPILYCIAFYFFVTAPLERRTSAAYLRRATGRQPSLFKVFLHFLTFSTVIMDRLFFLAGHLDEMSLQVHGLDTFNALRSSGRGFILVSGHFGSFEALRVLGIIEEGLPIKVLMYMENARQLNALFEDINPQVTKSVIPLGNPGAMLEVKEWIDQGGVVGILGDRITRGEKLTQVEFLGAPAEFPLGPWLLAGALEVPVMLCFAVYRGQGHYDIHLESLSEQSSIIGGMRHQTAARLAAVYAARLADYCREAPYNWFNFFDFWAETDSTSGHVKAPAR